MKSELLNVGPRSVKMQEDRVPPGTLYRINSDEPEKAIWLSLEDQRCVQVWPGHGKPNYNAARRNAMSDAYLLTKDEVIRLSQGE